MVFFWDSCLRIEGELSLPLIFLRKEGKRNKEKEATGNNTVCLSKAELTDF